MMTSSASLLEACMWARWITQIVNESCRMWKSLITFYGSIFRLGSIICHYGLGIHCPIWSSVQNFHLFVVMNVDVKTVPDGPCLYLIRLFTLIIFCKSNRWNSVFVGCLMQIGPGVLPPRE